MKRAPEFTQEAIPVTVTVPNAAGPGAKPITWGGLIVNFEPVVHRTGRLTTLIFPVVAPGGTVGRICVADCTVNWVAATPLTRPL